ncbi:MAG TPA: acyl-CoA dehydrogenase family protein [Chthoniobacterales bacterium]|nr:acyl-CoA dehydrogenase family protein [Chthoniobacterales bacterium]
MTFELTSEQRDQRQAFRAFIEANVSQEAGVWDRTQTLPPDVPRKFARHRYLVPTLPREAGGFGLDMLSFGLLNEEAAAGCGSVRNLMGVQGMVAHALLRWGGPKQKERYLARIGTGETLAAFALSEPGTGSDATNVMTTADDRDSHYVICGTKKWVSFGQLAGLYLVIAQTRGKAGAFLVDRETPGLTVRPIRDLLGLRASMLAELHFANCEIPKENLLGNLGAGFDFIANTALDYGRYSTAFGCVGLARACLEASLSHAHRRQQFGMPIASHQLVQQMLTDMIVLVESSRLLCLQAGWLRDRKDPDAIRHTLMAKYFASTHALKIASDAVQLHGASGCSAESSVERHWRDAKIQEIIEGTTQIQQIQIAKLSSPAGPQVVYGALPLNRVNQTESVDPAVSPPNEPTGSAVDAADRI